MILPARSSVARWLAPTVLLVGAFAAGRMSTDERADAPDPAALATPAVAPVPDASLQLRLSVPGVLELDGAARAADVDALVTLLATPLAGGGPLLDRGADGPDPGEVERLLSATLDAYLGPDARALLDELDGRPAAAGRRAIPPGPGGLRAVPILPEPVRQ